MTGPIPWELDAIEFTDGTVLRFMVLEGEVGYGVEGVFPGRWIGEEAP